MKLRDNILYHNNRKYYIKEEIGTGYFIENGDVLAQPVQVDGLSHDDELVTNNINDFDLSLDEIEKLDSEIRKALLE